MSIPYSGGAMGNILRLQGLKNASGRKVMPGAEFLKDYADEGPDVEGTSTPLPNFGNFIAPNGNTPELDQGQELNSQSYDVRANSQVPQQQEIPEQQPGFFSRLGGALAHYLAPASAEDREKAMTARSQARDQAIAQEQAQNQAPQVPPQEQPGLWNALKSEASKPYGVETLSNAWEGTKGFLKDNFTPTLDPIVYERNPNLQKPPELIQEQEQQKKIDQEQLDAAQMQPWQVAAYGATDAFANRPDLISDFQTYTGIDFDEQQKEMTEKYEKVLADLESGNEANQASYDEQENRIKQRILNNQSNDADKYYIGLALMMPLIIGGMFGKEAAVGALGGGAKGIADILGQRQKDIRSDEESLSDIYKQKSINSAKQGELQIEKLKIPQTVQKNLPKDEFEDLKGMDIHTFKDPNTGEIIGSGAEVLPDLYMDIKYGNTPKKREGMQEKASKLEEEKAALERANQATADVIRAAMQLKDGGMMAKILSYALSSDDNGALKKLVRQNAPEIMVDGRKQNSAVYIDSKIEQIKDAYRRNEQMKAFTNTVAAHIGSMAENPQYSGMKPADLIDQMLILRDRGQQFFVDRAGAQGFLTPPLENKFGKLNRTLYKELNTKEEKKQLERDKNLMYESE